MNFQAKFEIYSVVLNALSKGVALAAALRETDATAAEIKQVETQNQKLADQAAKLRRSMMKAWRGNAKKTLESIREENTKLQRRLRRIDEVVDIAEEVVKILGHLDTVITTAAKLLT